jgi:hypothetical protein
MDSESEISVSEFGNSTSYFTSKEEKALRIKVFEKRSITDILGFSYTGCNIIPEFDELILPEFDKGKIMTFNPKQNPGLTKSQKKFLGKLHRVLLNNNIGSTEPNFEKYIDELVYFLYDHGGFDDGEDLTMQPCNHTLEIKNEPFAAQADREGKRGTEIVWILCEDKHRSSRKYKKGETQIIACMIGAMQWNQSILNEVYPEKIIGIRVIGDRFCFYSATITEAYLEDLIKGMPKRDLDVMKYPAGDGLCISNISERHTILGCLSSLKYYALNLTPKYISDIQ